MYYSFWSNTIWYIFLFITSLAAYIATLIKSKNRKFTIVFTFATLGLLYHFESLLIISFNAYSYHPKLVRDPFMDSVFGNFFSQISISTTSSLSIEYSLSSKWYFLFSIIYFLIEELFLKLGIYQHYWYKSVYTLIGFIALFWFIKIWYGKLINSSKYFIHYASLYLATFAIIAHTVINPLKLLGIQAFKAGFYSELSKDHTTTATIGAFFLINIFIILYRIKLHRILKGIVFAILFLIQYILYKNGIIIYKAGWYPIVALYDLLAPYFWISVFDRFLSNKPSLLIDKFKF